MTLYQKRKTIGKNYLKKQKNPLSKGVKGVQLTIFDVIKEETKKH